jgi:mannose-6-phosphate isomerase-like protein (cupin superfamily)
VGVNYFAVNQWTLPTPELPQRFLSLDDPRRIPLPDILQEVQARYGGPLLITETSDAANRRADWIRILTRDAQAARARGVDLQGICFFPCVTCPDWVDPTAFFDGGIFDVIPQPDGSLQRVLSEPVAVALREMQAALDPVNLPVTSLPTVSPPTYDRSPSILKPREQARSDWDEYSYQTLIAGESLSVELYVIRPGGMLALHRHPETEHVLIVVSGQAIVQLGDQVVTISEGESVVVPAGVYYAIRNELTERLLVQQVSAPKPWDARYRGPHPSNE